MTKNFKKYQFFVSDPRLSPNQKEKHLQQYYEREEKRLREQKLLKMSPEEREKFLMSQPSEPLPETVFGRIKAYFGKS